MFVFYYKSNISHLSYTRTDEDGAGAGPLSQTEETSPQKITMAAAHPVTFNLYISDENNRFLFLFSFLMLLLSYNSFYQMYLCVQMIKS